jgi:hypothetical protein
MPNYESKQQQRSQWQQEEQLAPTFNPLQHKCQVLLRPAYLLQLLLNLKAPQQQRHLQLPIHQQAPQRGLSHEPSPKECPHDTLLQLPI